MNIVITVQVADEDVDTSDPTGLTEEAYSRITDALSSVTDGIVDIEAEV